MWARRVFSGRQLEGGRSAGGRARATAGRLLLLVVVLLVMVAVLLLLLPCVKLQPLLGALICEELLRARATARADSCSRRRRRRGRPLTKEAARKVTAVSLGGGRVGEVGAAAR